MSTHQVSSSSEELGIDSIVSMINDVYISNYEELNRYPKQLVEALRRKGYYEDSLYYNILSYLNDVGKKMMEYSINEEYPDESTPYSFSVYRIYSVDSDTVYYVVVEKIRGAKSFIHIQVFNTLNDLINYLSQQFGKAISLNVE